MILLGLNYRTLTLMAHLVHSLESKERESSLSFIYLHFLALRESKCRSGLHQYLRLQMEQWDSSPKARNGFQELGN